MKPEISIVIPAYDEEDRLSGPLGHLFEYLRSQGDSAEVILVDDGSSDGTAEAAKKVFDRHSDFMSKIIRYETNRGKGFAVRTGLRASNAEIALFSDADLSTPIEEMPTLVNPIRAGEYDVTFGSRAIDRSLIGTHQPWRREQGGKVMNLAIRKLSGLPYVDTQCGFKAFNMTNAVNGCSETIYTRATKDCSATSTTRSPTPIELALLGFYALNYRLALHCAIVRLKI